MARPPRDPAPARAPSEPVPSGAAGRSRVTEAQRRILDALKRGGPATAGDLAAGLGITAVAARQHLGALEAAGLVRAATDPPSGRGRPSVRWSIDESAGELFPDQHAELAVGLIGAIRTAVGEAGLARVVEVRARDQVALYRRLLPVPGASLERRVEALARRRTEEGYMAEVVREGRGVFLLVERHCPICDAARACLGLCAAELRVFREALGPDVEVERTKHLMSGDDRCAYRIRATPA